MIFQAFIQTAAAKKEAAAVDQSDDFLCERKSPGPVRPSARPSARRLSLTFLYDAAAAAAGPPHHHCRRRGDRRPPTHLRNRGRCLRKKQKGREGRREAHAYSQGGLNVVSL